MIKLDKAIIVEGKYDKIRLENIADAVIIETGGFRIFKNAEKRFLIRMLAEKHGIIVLTDSDSAGLIIRNHIKSIAPKGEIINVYLPQIQGKEKRKDKAGKEGLLGVEGTPDDIIESALIKYAVAQRKTGNITKSDLYNLGLSGTAQSLKRRKSLLGYLGMPVNISANAMIDIINSVFSDEEFFTEVKKWEEMPVKE